MAILPTYEGLYQANFPPLFKTLSNLLLSWNHSPLSWFGRMNAVRMTYLPNTAILLLGSTDSYTSAHTPYPPMEITTFYMGFFPFTDQSTNSIYSQDKWWPLSP